MSEFLQLLTPPEALSKFMRQLHASPVPEKMEAVQAANRVTLEPVIAEHPLPSFPRSTVDGYAVRAADSHGASEHLPTYLKLVDEVPMGGKPDFKLEKGECALIHTGGMLPEKADAVVMVETTQVSRSGEIEVLKAVGVGENVIKLGEDVQAGQEVISSGTRLRAAEIGGLMALGKVEVTVARRPKVAILSSGDEVVPPEKALQPGQVRDINTYTLMVLVEKMGGEPRPFGIIPDEPEAFRKAAMEALETCDVVVFTAGSSVSVRDLTAQTIDSMGEPGVLVHGVNVRPGKPTILAVCNGKAVIGLPGNPVSALIIANIFVSPVIEALLGVRKERPQPSVPARLSLNLSSQAGREDWIPVRLEESPDGINAVPIFGKSNLIFTLAHADGLIRIHADANGLNVGERVEVLLL